MTEENQGKVITFPGTQTAGGVDPNNDLNSNNGTGNNTVKDPDVDMDEAKVAAFVSIADVLKHAEEIVALKDTDTKQFNDLALKTAYELSSTDLGQALTLAMSTAFSLMSFALEELKDLGFNDQDIEKFDKLIYSLNSSEFNLNDLVRQSKSTTLCLARVLKKFYGI